MGKKLISLMLISFISLTAAGCANMVEKMNQLSINMDKNDVRNIFGKTFVAKASKVDSTGNVLDLWEFYDKKTKSIYQIYFLNDKISQWGKSDDLKTFPELHMPSAPQSEETDIAE